MGNAETKPKQDQDIKDPLRDYSTDVNLPTSISKPTSNLLLAYTDGHYFPCIIINEAKNISSGYLVYFLHSQEETEIPSNNCIGNLKVLMNCNVSFLMDGSHFCGQVCDMRINEKNEVTNFFISCKERCVWISLPFLFLTLEQVKQLLG